VEIINLPIERVIPYARNPRHNAEAVAKVAASIAEYGWRQPIVVDRDMVVVAGHTRLEAARRLGLATVPVHVATDLTPAQARAYRLMDNRSHQEARWNDELLALELKDLRIDAVDLSLTGFDAGEINQILAALDDDAGEDATTADSADPDATPEPPSDPVARTGDLWLLGQHRLLCGDSTDPAVVAQVMGGDSAALCFTSPPYGQQRDYTTGGIARWDALMQGVFAHLPMAPDGQVLVNLGLIHRDGEWLPYWSDWLDWMRTQGWRRFGLYVWDQGPGLPGDWGGRLAPSFEFVFHFNRQGRKPNKIVPCKYAGLDTHLRADGHSTAMRKVDGTVGAWTHAGQPTQTHRIPDSVIRIGRHKARGIEVEHPAVFPVALPELVLNAYADPGDIVYEPFSGSGTTLIAGERTGRRVCAIDLAPAYVDVAVRRWNEQFPANPARLEGGGTFAETAAARGVTLAMAA
jgi:DNA modification methylase